MQNSNNGVLAGSAGADSLAGSSGNDTLYGYGGDDTLDGLGGRDVLWGGEGSDTFVLDQAPGSGNADEIQVFESYRDDFRLDATVMPELGPSGRFSWSDVRFYSAIGATGGHDADDRIVYDTGSGNLYYDPDGSGAWPRADPRGGCLGNTARNTISSTTSWWSTAALPGW